MPPMHPANTDLILTIGNWILYSSAVPVVAFTIIYALRSNWRSTMPGRAIFWLTLSLSLTLVLSVVTAVFGPDWPFRGYVRIGVLGFVSFSMWRLLVVLIKVQNPERAKELLAKARARARRRDQQS